MKKLLAVLVLAGTMQLCRGAMQSSVSQWGITFTFDKQYQVGTFANGDYWVVGPLTITAITPAFDGKTHGWQVNPKVGAVQGFDAGAWGSTTGPGGSFDARLVPALPYPAKPGESIVKAVSKFPGSTADCYDQCLKSAAVLTVVGSVPPDNGQSVFRPPYVGTDKPLYSTNSIRTDVLPKLAPVPGAPTLTAVKSGFERVRFEHGTGRMGRIIRPADAQSNYSPDNHQGKAEAVLRLILNDQVEAKMPALIAVLQAGIDEYHAILNGQTWPAGGGYEMGHLLIVSFTAAVLDDAAMKNAVKTYQYWQEDWAVYRSTKIGKALYGFTPPRGSSKTQKDPYEYIDAPNGGYLTCCFAQPWKGEVLSVRLMPALYEIRKGTEFNELAEFVDRWVATGWWSAPDPYNRNLARHGTEADGGLRYTVFQRAMWTMYHTVSPVGIVEPSSPSVTEPGRSSRMAVVPNPVTADGLKGLMPGMPVRFYTTAGKPVGSIVPQEAGMYVMQDINHGTSYKVVLVK